MLKVMTVVGTRPEIIKLSRVIPELDKHFEHVLVHTGQNYNLSLSAVFFKELKIRRPDTHLGNPGNLNVVEFIGMTMAGVDSQLNTHKPDAVLILGDTNSCVAAAYAAKRRQVPIFHMEAGNRCFDQRTPEEINRKIVDHLSDINMVYTEHARRNLLAEGVKPDTIVKTGSPMNEVLEHYMLQINASTIQAKIGVHRHAYFVVSVHREENVDDPARLGALLETLCQLSKNYPAYRIVFPIHPRTRARMTVGQRALLQNVCWWGPLGFPDYIALQRNALCVLSDSGTLTEEAALLGFPAVMLRQSHERPEGMDAGITIMSDLDPGKILPAVELAIDQGPQYYDVDGYQDYAVAEQVARTILSYTDFVNRTVWHK